MTTCRICNNSCVTHRIFDNYSLAVCTNCGYSQLSPYPDAIMLGNIYRKEYFDEKILDDHISDSKYKFKRIKKYLNQGSTLLDYGCGTGNILKAASKDGIKISGYDLSEFAADVASSTLNVRIKSGPVTPDIYQAECFDYVSMFDVIEHIPDFENILLYINLWLKKGGYLFLTTPNLKSWDALIFGKHWYGFKKYPEHINFFTPQAITILLEKSGFQIVNIQTLGFVRSVHYIINHSHLPKSFILKICKLLPRWFKDLNIYIPMTDMIVVAKNISQRT